MVKHRDRCVQKVVETPSLKTQIDRTLDYLTETGPAWAEGFKLLKLLSTYCYSMAMWLSSKPSHRVGCDKNTGLTVITQHVHFRIHSVQQALSDITFLYCFQEYIVSLPVSLLHRWQTWDMLKCSEVEIWSISYGKFSIFTSSILFGCFMQLKQQ